MTDKIIVLTTCGSPEEARGIANGLLAERLAACVNILPAIQSIYRWKGEIAEGAEVLLLIKTRRELFDTVAKGIRRHHSYELPEIIAVPVVDGLASYLKWIDDETDACTQGTGVI